jgi:heterodisulfide reductase subunit C
VSEQQYLLEEQMDHEFLHEVASIPGGEQVKDCIQCGSCSGSCPTSYLMDYTPRRLFAMIRGGMKDEVLSSETIWLCTSCYTCQVRCPQNIKITDVMYALKRLALTYGKASSKQKAPIFSQEFVNLINRYGRNHEIELMTRFMLKSSPLHVMKNAGVGLKLLSHKRLPLLPHKIKGVEQIRKIIKKVEQMGGA